MTTGMRPRERRPGTLEFRLKAAEDSETYRQWLDTMRHQFLFMTPELCEHLLECHRKVGPLSQYRDFVALDHFNVRERIHTLRPPLLLIRGADDPNASPEYELEIHQAVPGSLYLKVQKCRPFSFRRKTRGS